MKASAVGGLDAGPPSEVTTVESTEPCSQSEIDARMKSFWEERQMHEAAAAAHSAVHLDDLVVPEDKDIRILVRPLTRARSVSPGNLDNCEWLQLTAEVAEPNQPEQKVLAVTQTERTVKFSVRMPGESLENRPPLWCELYFDPSSEDLIFYNSSELPLTLSRVSQQPVQSPGLDHVVDPHRIQQLGPGTWRIKVIDINVIDFRIVEKRPAVRRLLSDASSSSASPSDNLNLSGKRGLDTGGSITSPDKRLRAEDSAARSEDGVVMFMRPGNTADSLVVPFPSEDKGKEIMSTKGNPLIELEDGATVEIPGGEVYTIKKVDLIASTSLSAVARAEFSKVPDSIITVKVLKTSLRANVPAPRPHDEARNVMRQSETWLREFLNHEQLNHKSIPRLFGGDARYLSLYMEHIEAKDLTTRGLWQNAQTTMFMGRRSDAERILRDISSALDYLHGQNLTHNDIKPGNIMYNPQRGAVLCDFGMSFDKSANQHGIGGTPYYIGPEFIGHRMRGVTGDVWALGVTMLYVLGKIGFPEARALKNHPRHLYWQIRDVNTSSQPQRGFDGQTAGQTAVQKMRIWLDDVGEAKKRLNLKDKVERLVAEMLTLKPTQRITMRKVVEGMAKVPVRSEG
ncbi:hypothetical protein M406DRAFT_291319 [Cryphonectria parasitica EP155]|uniref:Protein kinase domain-containing protein n=1 Tax=Cryphonectria parasitica (strain ATCC 38755 / EP155) TaxID=660469 RepID=A0A9P4Y0F1_CRYP1|nr:uncharacterized protein M406DRAFT_291319 [Cryphonectria parasitica EP155]KAF3764266.1 hypothetical protein M406DRAFT_291319 [Cryphonectria parasitica EP155]